jgi:hypothetical protein
VATKPKDTGLNPDLEKILTKLMKETCNSHEASLTDKCKIIDRVLKLEQMKQKMQDESMGSGFHDSDDD